MRDRQALAAVVLYREESHAIKLVAAMAATILGTLTFDSSAARADTFYMCGHEIHERQPVIGAIYSGVGFAWMYSRIAIRGYDTPETGGCNVVLH